MKKRTLKRFGAVLCAFAICLFSVFGVNSLFSKKDNNLISASAEEVEYEYYLNFVYNYDLYPTVTNYISLNNSSVLSSSFVRFRFSIVGSYIYTLPRLLYSNLLDDVDDSLRNFYFIIPSVSSYEKFYFSLSESDYETNSNCNSFYIQLLPDDFLETLEYVDDSYTFPFTTSTSISWRISSNSSNSLCSGSLSNNKYSFRITRRSPGYSQEDLDNARESGYNNGYALGQLFGKAEGEIIGQNNAGVNSSELFAGVKANLYVRSGEDLISSGLNVDVSQVVDEFYPNLPLWQLQITDGVISKDSTDTYVLELLLPIYVKYPTNTLYLGAGANATGVVGRVTGVSGYLYPQKENYDGGVVTAPLPAGFESFYNIKSVAFTNPPTEDYYLSSVMISFTANPVRDSSFLLTLTTQELLNDYINTFNESYTTGEQVGYEEGKTVGYNEGVEDAHTYTFLNLMVAVIDAPIKSFTGMLDFEILGMNMQAFFLSLLTSALVLAAYRLFSGGKA